MTTAFYHGDHLGSTRMMTSAGGWPVSSGIFLPYGEEYEQQPTTNHYKFTGKERDAESNLNYFGARYYATTQGRFMTPDEPFEDQHPEDPQSWNLYAYVRNRPLIHADPTGRACNSFLGNTGSAYCKRANFYQQLDQNAVIRSQTRFFAAAASVSRYLANVDARPFGVGIPKSAFSDTTRTFLARTGDALRSVNEDVAKSVLGRSLEGKDLDAKIVNIEQTKVQQSLDELKKSDSAAYNTVIAEANKALNPPGGGWSPSETDQAFLEALNGVRDQLGRDIDFANQSDREAIGMALIEQARKKEQTRKAPL